MDVLTTPSCHMCQEQPPLAAQTALLSSVNLCLTLTGPAPDTQHIGLTLPTVAASLALHHLATVWISTLCLDDALCHFCLLI